MNQLTKATMSSVLAACALLLAFAASPSRALASTSANWGVGTEATPPANAGPNPEVSLGSVSCTSPGNCTAVGDYTDGAGELQGAIWTETSGTWGAGVEPAPPSAGGHTFLKEARCPSAGNCTAVGYFTDSSHKEHLLLLSETAGTWGTGVEATLPANAAAEPEALGIAQLSCPSAGDCAAAGVYTDSSGHYQGLLLSETAGAWEPGVEATMPANVNASGPAVGTIGLSCPAVGDCAVVGTYTDTAGTAADFLLSETSGTWGAAVQARMPANAEPEGNAMVRGVSCPSVGNCAVAGLYIDTTSTLQGFLLDETSGTWGTGLEPTPPLNGRSEPRVRLSEVQCASVGDCTAVGGYRDSVGNEQGLLLTETAGTWGTGVEAPLPAGARSGPLIIGGSLSCPSAGDCGYVGDYYDSALHQQGLLLTENKGTWAPALQARLPAGARSAPEVVLDSASCASPGHCTAVGSYEDSGGHRQGLLLSAAPSAVDVSIGGPLGGAYAGSPIPASALAATLAGGSAPSGTVTFTVFGPQASPPTSCVSGGALVGSASASGDGAYLPSAAFTPPSPGDYWWYASYGGDVGDEPSASACGPGMAETTVLEKATPTLSAGGPVGAVAGSAIAASSISATLAGGSSPSGTITFTVFGPQSSPPSSCSEGGTTVGAAVVSGNGAYQPSGGFTPRGPGEYWWYASYGGSAGDNAAASPCGAPMGQTLVTAAQTGGSGAGPGSIAGSGAGAGGAAKRTAPTLSHAKLLSGHVASRRTLALTVTVSQATTIDVVIAQEVKAHKLGGACRLRAKRGRRCTIAVRRRISTFSGTAGSNTLELRLAGLRDGSYTATVSARNANGHATPVVLTFAIAHG